MATKKDFMGAITKMTNREVVLSGSNNKENKPFGEALREELEREAKLAPIREIPVAQLGDNPFQHLARPSLDEEAMVELVNSIQQNGFYGALLARRKRGGTEQYELAFGHRRREAARRLGLLTVPVKIIELTDTEMARIMASENFAREDLTPLGEANVVGYLNTTQNLSVPQIAKIVGKGEGWINLRLRLYKAPQNIKDMVEQRPETLTYVRLLEQVIDLEQRARFISNILTGTLTREQLETQLKSLKTDPKVRKNKENIVTNITDTIPDSDSDLFHNVGIENRTLIETIQPLSDKTTLPEAVFNSKSSAGLDYRAQYNQALNALGTAIKNLEQLSQADLVTPDTKQQAYLVDIMERLNTILTVSK